MEQETEIGGAARVFPTTRWSLIRSVQESPQTRREALETLLATYWKPLYFFARRKGATVEAAKDAVQGFYAHVLETDFLSRPDPARGRFRSYVRTALENWMKNEHARQTAQKRGGDVRAVPLDFEMAEQDLAAAADVPDAFEREWALGIMERCLGKLEDEFRGGKRSGPFEAVARFFRIDEPPTYEETASAHGLTVSQFKALLHRTRQRFRELIRQEVSQTLSDPAEADDEIRTLVEALQT